jgi:DNA-binding CsgD family transcriptional regulator
MQAKGPDPRWIERIDRICHQGGDAQSLRVALLDEIRQIIAFDAYAWLLTDPETEVGCSPLAEVPWFSELPRQIRLKYLSEVNRWTHIESVALLSSTSGGQLESSLVWRELLKDYGVSDAASIVFRDRYGCWAFMELWRIGGAPFDDHGVQSLSAIVPLITGALRRANASTFRPDPPPPPATGPVVLMLSSDLEVKGQTPDTEKYLRLLLPSDDARRPVPAAAYNVGAQLAALEAGVDHHQPMARVHLADGIWLTLRAARIAEGFDQTAGDIAVTIQRSSPGERLRVFALASGLTPREAELLTHLATGIDTRKIAKKMFVSENTVQDHLKSIFDKTETRSRNSLLARAIGVETREL